MATLEDKRSWLGSLSTNSETDLHDPFQEGEMNRGAFPRSFISSTFFSFQNFYSNVL